jgi:hypothetical protein
MKKTHSFTSDFFFGDRVALKTEPDIERIVTGLILRPSGKMYEIACGLEASCHQEVEIENFSKVQVSGFKNNKSSK